MSHRVPPVASPAAAPRDVVAIDPSARAIAMLGFGPTGMRVVRRWIEQVPAGTPVTWAAAQRADAVSLAELERLVTGARPGWRLMLAGPEADVRAAREVALRLGLLGDEVRTALTGREPRRVWCPHCTATTETEALPGESVHCCGCTVPLRVTAAVSRSHGASVGIVEGPAAAHHVA
ncbi:MULTISPECIES: dimethylamine monooxygenase subunit DmmA family protein [unclassified Blastococcus]